MDLGLRGRHAVVCGASSGIGRAAADALAREGVNLTLVARRESRLAEAAEEIQGTHAVQVDYVAADLGSPDGRARVTAARSSTDILICNPGIPQRPEDFESLGRDDWERWFDAHFYSVIELIQHYAPRMRQQGFGRIVNVSVSFIKFPPGNAIPSHAARLALAGTIASLVRELIPGNTTINSVLPGLIDTPALRAAVRERAERAGISFELALEQTVQACPARRMAQPSEVGDLIAMLCGAQMGFMTGQNIVVDGGAYPGLF